MQLRNNKNRKHPKNNKQIEVFEIIIHPEQYLSLSQMRSARSLSYHQLQPQQHTHQIKCYLKLYQSNGLASPQSHPPLNYQILDENTLLRKTFAHKKQQYEMYPFTRVFSARIGNHLMSKQVCFADDLQQGINHTTIAIVDSHTKRLLTTGSTDQHGIFIEYFLTLFENFSTTYYTTKSSSLFLSMFSTVNQKPNQFIDLINGQRYTFLSKKDVDSASYKTFYELKILTVQEFLIALKIAMVRFQECCTEEDFVVFRMGVLNEDEFSDKKTTATGNVIVCHRDNKNTQIFIKQLQTLINHPSTSQSSKIKDHGSLFSCMQPYLRNGKLSFIQCLLNDYDHFEANLAQIKRIPSVFMSKSCTYRVNRQQMGIESFLHTRGQKSAKQIAGQKNQLSSITNLSTKELEKFREIFASYKMFVKESIQKLGQFARLYKQVIQTRQQFYQRQRFPVSLQIKEQEDLSFIIKSFYIAKIYSLSEKFQMASLQSQSQKMMTIKHQIFLSLKSLASTLAKKGSSQDMDSNNNNNSFSSAKNNSYILLDNKKTRSDSIDQGQKSSERFQKLTKIMRNQLQCIKNNLKYIFGIDSKSLIKQNHHEHGKKDKKNKKQKETEMIFALDDVDFSKLFNQQLMVEMEKLIKTLLSKRDSNHAASLGNNIANQNTDRQNIELLIIPSHRNLSPTDQSNSRIIVLNQREKNVSQHFNQQQSPSESKTQRRMKKLMSEPQNLEKSLLEVKREQMSKHLQIKHELKKFHEVKENVLPVNRSKVALTQADNCVFNKEEAEKDLKARVQNEKENVNVTVEVTQQKKSKHKQRSSGMSHQYQLVYQNTIKKKKDSQPNEPLFQTQLSQHSHTLNPPKRISSLIKKAHITKASPLSNLGLPQIRRSPQKSLNIDQNLRQTIIHSPKNKRKQLMKVVNNLVVDEGEGKIVGDRRKANNSSSGEGNKSFLPGIGLLGRRIEA